MNIKPIHVNAVLAGVVAAIAAPVPAIASESIVNRFHRTYQALQSVRCTFVLDGTHTGQLFAMRGKGYVLAMADRRIISNGTTVWNITPATKTVIVNNALQNGEDLSLERLFFTLLSVYRASAVQGATNQLDLRPPAPAVRVAGVQSARVTVDDNMRVTKVVVNDGATESTWVLKNLQLNAKPLATERFTYEPPSGWTTVDLR